MREYEVSLEMKKKKEMQESIKGLEYYVFNKNNDQAKEPSKEVYDNDDVGYKYSFKGKEEKKIHGKYDTILDIWLTV